MIVDSHAHYAHASFSNTFRYLSWEDNWTLKEGTLEELLSEMADRGITMSVEPGISLDFNERILEMSKRYPGRIFPAAVRWAISALSMCPCLRWMWAFRSWPCTPALKLPVLRMCCI